MTEPRDRLKTLIYILLRDYLPLGTMNTVIAHHIKPIEGTPVFSDKDLGSMAERITNELLGEVEGGK